MSSSVAPCTSRPSAHLRLGQHLQQPGAAARRFLSDAGQHVLRLAPHTVCKGVQQAAHHGRLNAWATTETVQLFAWRQLLPCRALIVQLVSGFFSPISACGALRHMAVCASASAAADGRSTHQQIPSHIHARLHTPVHGPSGCLRYRQGLRMALDRRKLMGLFSR